MSEINFSTLLERIKNDDCALNYLDLSSLALTIEELRELKAAIKNNTIIGNIKWGTLPIHPESNSAVHAIEIHLRNNVFNFQLYPDAYQYGLLSLHSYYDANAGDTLTLPDKNHYLHLKSWQVHTVYRNDSNGYYGVLYQNTKNCQLVLAQRGTEFMGLKAELLGHKDISADINGIVLNKIVAPIFEAYKAVKNSIEIAKQVNHHLSFTGHSLGAWLAELSIYLGYRHFDYKTARVLTFDSPGSRDFFNTLQSNIDSHRTTFDMRDLDIITYLSIPNVINSCNRHLGDVYAVTPIITQEQLNHYYSEWQSSTIKSFFMNADSIIPAIAVLGHSLESIIGEFNATTGMPNEYKQMLDWPCITCSYDSHNDRLAGGVDKVIGVIPRQILSMFLPGSTKTLPGYKIANMILDIIHGEIDISQYLRVINDEVLKYIKREEKLSKDEQERLFYLKFEGHFDSMKPNPYIEPLKGKKTEPDWYLSQFIKHYHYFSYPPKDCNLTDVVQKIIIYLSIHCYYSSSGLHDIHQHGVLNSTEFGIPIDQLKQSVIRLNEISSGTVKKCLDLYEKPELWYGELMAKSGKHDATVITKEYIENGGDVNKQDSLGNTLLHQAIANHREEAALLLINNGADTSIKNNAGEDVYDTAVRNYDFSMVNSIQQFKHIPSSTSTIILDKYGIYDGNEQSNIFVITPGFEGKKDGYQLVIDNFEMSESNKDKIDLQQFGYHDFSELKLRNENFAGKKAVQIVDAKTNEDVVVILNSDESTFDPSLIIFAGPHDHPEL